MDAGNVVNKAAVSDPQPVPYGIKAGTKVADLKDETLTAFSDSPYEYESTTADLWDDTQKVYYNACVANRFSENYLMLCEQLEKNIKQLGSMCLTKAALEQKGLRFPKLAGMNILSLVKMVSFHFRKAHAALEGVYIDNNILALSYLNWEFRWVGLGNRLKATEFKIQKIKSGEIKIESMVRQAEAVNGGAVSAEPDQMHGSLDKATAFLPAAPAAFPVKSSVVRNILGMEPLDIRDEIRLRREEERRQKEEMRQLMDVVCLSGEEGSPIPLRDLIEEANFPSDLVPEQPMPVSEEEARKILVEDAKQRNDQEAAALIPTEDPVDLLIRWDLYSDRISSP